MLTTYIILDGLYLSVIYLWYKWRDYKVSTVNTDDEEWNIVTICTTDAVGAIE